MPLDPGTSLVVPFIRRRIVHGQLSDLRLALDSAQNVLLNRRNVSFTLLLPAFPVAPVPHTVRPNFQLSTPAVVGAWHTDLKSGGSGRH